MIILHGEDTVKSRLELEKLKTFQKGREIINLDGSKLELTELIQAFEAKSLFGQDRLVVIENFFTERKKGKEQDKIIEYLKALDQKIELIIWEGKELNRSIFRLFPKAEIKIFKLDPALFRFLEALKPGDQKKMVDSFRQALLQEDVNLLFYMLIRQFRLLLFVKDGQKKGLEEFDRMADWQKAKISQQAKYFSSDELSVIYHCLLEIDWREKSGLAPQLLTQTLELFLANL